MIEVYVLAPHGREIVAEVATLEEAADEMKRLMALDDRLGVLICRKPVED